MFASFRTLVKAYNDFVTGCLDGYDLSPNEIAVLSALDGVTTASVIARDAGVSKALVSRSVKSLKQRGLIETSISEIDKREQNLSLTEKGEQVAAVVRDANDRFCEIALKDANEEILEVTSLMLEVIMRNLVAGGEE